MNAYPYKKLNAFTSKTSKGNPAAYLMLGREKLSHEQMLAIGKEHAGFVSEIVFCSESSAAAVKLTYYSSECEVEFCGHGTIATMYDLIANNERFRAMPELQIETSKKGILTVYNAIDGENAVYITAPAAQQLETALSAKDIAEALGVALGALDASYPIGFVDAGLRTLIVPVSALETEVSVYPKESSLKEFVLANGIDIILMFSKAVKNHDCLAHTRVFAPKFGYLEDPATGSGNSAFANYLLKYGLWDGNAAVVEQGGDNIEFNPVMLKTKGKSVLFGGSATVVIDGHYYI